MAVRTGQQYIEGLRDGREVWYDGQRVKDVTTFEPMVGAIRSMAMLYDLQHDPAHRDVLTVESPEFGERIARPFEIPRTREQLRAKREAYAIAATATCGMMGRSPDFMNVMLTALAAKRSFVAEYSEQGAEAVVAYYRYMARNDLFMTHALLDPQLDKGKLRHQQRNPEVPLHVAHKTAEGLIVRGSKRIATAAPYTDELMVWPFPPTFQAGEEPYANVFCIPMNTPGLKTVCRPSFAAVGGLRADNPLSAAFDEMDATIFCDDVLVPWDRVFLHGNNEALNRYYRDSRMRELTAHQTNVRLEVKLAFLYALCVRMAQASGMDKRPDVIEALGEAAMQVEIIRSAVRASEEQAEIDPENGVLYPDLFALQVGRAYGPIFYPAMLALVKKLGGGGLIQLPVSMSEFDSPIGPDLDATLGGAGLSGRDKTRLFKLAWDVVGTPFGVRHELYEMNYAGERGLVLAGIHREYTRKASHLDVFDRFMDSL